MKISDVERNLAGAVTLLKALSNESRLKIICALYQGEKCVGELVGIVGLQQSALSQHLACLRQDGLVKTRREAQAIYYSIGDNAPLEILATLYRIYCQPEDTAGQKNPGGSEEPPGIT
ncbi:MAG: winged helix-turn-helix transcriptional regulator [Rhodospirillales bacterium]|nr:winged helix-turn-helix transcriptional regulator [Rhodospirillales bacterium]MCB9997095.1 winged helix-turn-helix transcriptional regulator [Rhodospirillales bacterium]